MHTYATHGSLNWGEKIPQQRECYIAGSIQSYAYKYCENSNESCTLFFP